MDLLGFEQFIRGATFLGSSIISLFFFRFWRTTRDILFFYFALCFALFACTRIGLGIVERGTEANTYFYLMRLAAFVLLIFAIIHKNSGRSNRHDVTRNL
jgi:uncharacterized protein DUF5985